MKHESLQPSNSRYWISDCPERKQGVRDNTSFNSARTPEVLPTELDAGLRK